MLPPSRGLPRIGVGAGSAKSRSSETLRLLVRRPQRVYSDTRLEPAAWSRWERNCSALPAGGACGC